MKKLVSAMLLCLPLSAFAAAPPVPPTPPGPPHPPGDRRMERMERMERFERELSPEQRERMERHARLQRVLGLAEELDLSSAEALKLDEVLRRFDERRKPLRQQVSDSAKTLEKASEGDQAALGGVDQAAQRIFDARAQMAQLDKEMFSELSKGLKPQQKAKMAVYFAKFDNANTERRVLIRKRLHGGDDGPHGPHGMPGEHRMERREKFRMIAPPGGGEHEIEIER